MNILIVDDDRYIRSLLFHSLEHLHEVSVLANGHNVMSVLADPAHHFHLVLMDVKMPRMNGDTVIRQLSEFGHIDTRFVLMTGMAQVDHYKNLPKVIGILHKPFDLVQMMALVQRQEQVQAQQAKVLRTRAVAVPPVMTAF